MEYEPVLTFSGNPLDRANNRRKDEAFLESCLTDPASVCLPFRRLAPLLSRSGAKRPVTWKNLKEVMSIAGGVEEVVLLGLRDGVAHYAVEVTEESAKQLAVDGAAEFIDIRRLAPYLVHEETGILAQARALLEWHSQHKFCGVCGHPTRPIEGGTKRQCTNVVPKTNTDPSVKGCGRKEYPRTNPVVIMLVIHPDGTKCLLGTQNRMGFANFWSCLAGFMDSGETIEEAVRREVFEESGVEVGKVTYFATQPWPFGLELMIGCFAYATKDEINVDRKEIADAQWFSADQIEKGIRAVAENPGLFYTSKEWRVPPASAIAHQLMAAWLHSLGRSPSSTGSSALATSSY